jgi:prepilin-type N-terminal cleavage/methylation domain-containing protein
MKCNQSQKGFTLVELAIVMTIIGLLIGGILKGQELMENARTTATVAQVKSYEAATTSFRDSYNGMPGDLRLAQNRVPNCTANCNPVAATAGNSIIGAPGWGAGAFASQSPAAGMAKPPTVVGEETNLYWQHLLLSDLISGVTDSAIAAVPAGAIAPAWGETHPSARLGGGFIVGYNDGTAGPGMPAGTIGPAGTVLALVTAPAAAIVGAIAGTGPLSPSRAAQIDRKLDDGKPTKGFVQAYGPSGVGAPATDVCHDTATDNYYEANTRKSCGLIFRIQG